MERLTIRHEDKVGFFYKLDIKTYPKMNETIKDLLRRSDEPMDLYVVARLEELEAKLKAYEDTGLTPEEVAELVKAKEGGRLVVLPCKKGDVLWSFYNWPREGIYSFCVTATSMLDGVSMLNTDKVGVIPTSDVGKTVFLTREEAEAARAARKEQK